MSFINRISRLYKEKFVLRSSLLVVAASFIGSFFAYLFQIVSGRYLSVSDYATLVALFSLTTIIMLSINVITNAVPKIVAEIKDDDYPNRISTFFYSLTLFKLILAVLLTVILYLLSDNIANYLHITDAKLMKVFILALGIGIFISHLAPFLQGLLRFKAFSFITILIYFSRFLIAVIVSLLGLTLIQLYVGIVASGIFAAFLAFLLLRKNIIFKKLKELDSGDLKLLIKYSIGGASALIGITLIQNADIILVKHFFSPIAAGIYSSASIVGRVVFFASSPVAIVMLPICAERYKKGKDYLKPFWGSLGLTILIAGSITLFYILFPELVTKTFFGDKYTPGANLLPLYAIFMFSLALLNIVAAFFIAISEFRLSMFAFLAALLQYAGIHFYKNDLKQVITVSIISILLSFATLFIFLGFRKIRTGKILS